MNGRVIEIVLVKTAKGNGLGGSAFLMSSGKLQSIPLTESGFCCVPVGNDIIEAARLETTRRSSVYGESDWVTTFLGPRGSQSWEDERRKEECAVKIHDKNALNMSLKYGLYISQK